MEGHTEGTHGGTHEGTQEGTEEGTHGGTHRGDTRGDTWRDTHGGHTASQRELELGSPREGPDTREGDEVPAGSPKAAQEGSGTPVPAALGPQELGPAPPAPRCPPPRGQPGDGAALGMTHERHPSRSGDTHATSCGAAAAPRPCREPPARLPPSSRGQGSPPGGCVWTPGAAARCHPGSGAGISPPGPGLATGTGRGLGALVPAGRGDRGRLFAGPGVAPTRVRGLRGSLGRGSGSALSSPSLHPSIPASLLTTPSIPSSFP